MAVVLIRREFSSDHITRQAGERLRQLILDFANKGESIVIDFSGVTIASTSFLDEGLAKLADDGWSAEIVNQKITLKNIHARDRDLLRQLSLDRWKEQGDIPRW
ncbi:MAG TPA: STAS-like domain-containing protein [Bdellovibrionota bacterium]|nr:STAS-like domain-containing protein [Bdellovibrionota bacterium]